ncbi:LysR substrate-binding domain-containing protein [Gallaecimonas sp. GXIMD4217]|uniref:LysR substrate-binding domain-containing protein n=1 Tax=Gallaecimonas sp. GXIMD4217 TaxID=3131927 RepID=UPI00311AE21B
MNRLPPLRALQVFEAAARLGHFQQAAQELNISASAVSHQLRTLEAYLGEPLFSRQGRRQLLTEAGTRYFAGISPLLQEIGRLTAQLRGEEGVRLRLAVFSSFATKWLIPRLPKFESRHPDWHLELEMKAELADIERSQAELLITHGPLPPGFVGEPLHRERLVAVCSPHMAMPDAPEALGAGSPVILEVVEETWPTDWQLWERKTGIALPAGARRRRFSHLLLAIEAAICAQGIALAPDFIVADDIRLGRLVALPWPQAETDLVFTFGCKGWRMKEPLVRAFRQWLKREAQKPLSLVKAAG